ncbi:hypothetical protein [Arhodomonas sp. AD133]|uniref:hypothetical protein n=1 Tax=Arhodomonas sp. AD133 TaxID=3415009 RepID=UPI003EBA336C
MGTRHRYVTLLASLPPLPDPPFGRQPLPISPIRLDRRLTLLGDDDRAALEALLALVDWRYTGTALSDSAFIRRYREAAQQFSDHDIGDFAETIVEHRTVVAALRRQRQGATVPQAGTDWGIGPHLAHIRAHWSQPLLGLAAVFPWLAEARRYLADGEHRELERLLLGVEWRWLTRARCYHRFDFRAVVNYVLRWRIVAAWRRYNAEAAERRLRRSVHEGLGAYRTLFPAAMHPKE